MADKKPGDIIATPRGGVLHDIVLRLKLVLRLMADNRVSFLLKALPIASLIYLFSPIDLASGVVLPVIGALDDAAILGLGFYLFVELAPPNVVQEHLKNLSSNLVAPPAADEVVDAEATDVPDDKP
jgi:uncharacterized membrane protein YkvA (DUF1232 family)